MEMLKRFEPLALFFMFIGALNWGIVGLFEENLLAEIFGTGTLADIVYVLIGAAAIVYLPKMLEALHLGDGPHPRGV